MPDHEIIQAFPSSQLPHVGTYRRVLPVSLVRMYENTLDWEHLPHVHESSFEDEPGRTLRDYFSHIGADADSLLD